MTSSYGQNLVLVVWSMANEITFLYSYNMVITLEHIQRYVRANWTNINQKGVKENSHKKSSWFALDWCRHNSPSATGLQYSPNQVHVWTRIWVFLPMRSCVCVRSASDTHSTRLAAGFTPKALPPTTITKIWGIVRKTCNLYTYVISYANEWIFRPRKSHETTSWRAPPDYFVNIVWELREENTTPLFLGRGTTRENREKFAVCTVKKKYGRTKTPDIRYYNEIYETRRRTKTLRENMKETGC